MSGATPPVAVTVIAPFAIPHKEGVIFCWLKIGALGETTETEAVAVQAFSSVTVTA